MKIIILIEPELTYLKYLLALPLLASIASNDPIPLYFLSLTPSEKKYSPGHSVVPANKLPIMTGQEEKKKDHTICIIDDNCNSIHYFNHVLALALYKGKIGKSFSKMSVCRSTWKIN